MKRVKILAILLMIALMAINISCKFTNTEVVGPTDNVTAGAYSGNSGPNSNNLNFPSDFGTLPKDPGLMQGFNGTVGGFGGNVSMTKEQNRAALKYRPVLLIHGQGGKANGTYWGFQALYSQLIDLGYNPSELWGISYLGTQNGTWADAPTDNPYPYGNNVDELRAYVIKMMDYLGVNKIDVIAHSLGAGLIRALIHGYTKSDTDDPNSANYHVGNPNGKSKFQVIREMKGKIGTVILVCGANYGFSGQGGEWDPTYKSSDGVSFYEKVNQAVSGIRYVAVRSVQDFVDANTPASTPVISGLTKSTSYFIPAVENITRDYTSIFVSGTYVRLERHQAAVRRLDAFNTYSKYLKNTNDEKPVSTISPNGGEFENSVDIQITASNNPTLIEYQIGTEAQTEPVEANWITFTSKTITENCSVFARARNANGLGEWVKAVFKKKIPGLPVVTINPIGGEFNTYINVTLSASENANEIHYKINDGSWNIVSNPYTLTVTETALITAFGKNNVGSGTEKSAQFTKKELPSISVKFKVTSLYAMKKVQIIATPGDATIKYKLLPYLNTWTATTNNSEIYVYSYNTYLKVQLTSGGTTKQFYIQNPSSQAVGEYNGIEEPVN